MKGTVLRRKSRVRQWLNRVRFSWRRFLALRRVLRLHRERDALQHQRDAAINDLTWLRWRISSAERDLRDIEAHKK